MEQLAGDELADYASAKEITPEVYDNLVATGFLRMAPDATWANITGFVPDRIEVIADEIDVLGSAVLGLTMKCARCHTHKFDPIPHRDYYRLVAVFKGALRRVRLAQARDQTGHRPGEHRHGPAAPPAVRDDRRAQGVGGEEGRAGAEGSSGVGSRRAVADVHLPAGRLPAARRGSSGRACRRCSPTARRRSRLTPPWPGAKQTGRRLAFAKWVTQPDHPLTARVMVNRIWKHHFGTGIVPTLANFGKAGAPPTHPELLDWLAREFVEKKWSVKAMHRLMMTSTTYRQSSVIAPEAKKLDPANALLFADAAGAARRGGAVRFAAAVAGRLDETRGGPADAVQVAQDGLVTPTGTAKGWRRLIYVQQTRKHLPTHAETFDFPQ